MKTTEITQIVKSYENQLANAEIAKDKKQIKWLNQQINEGYKMIAQFGTYNH